MPAGVDDGTQLRLAGEGEASPGGGPVVAFPVKSSGPGEVVFENLKHDFPKRITYRRDGEALVAQIGDESGKGPGWRFLPADKVRCP